MKASKKKSGKNGTPQDETPAEPTNGAAAPDASTVDAVADEAASKVAGAAIAGAKRGPRFTLAILANAKPELVHRAVKAAIPSAWRVTVPNLEHFTADQWRIILTWLALEYRVGVEAGMLEALKEIEADEAAKKKEQPRP